MLEIVLHGEKIGEVLGFPITNTIIMAWFATGVLILGAFLIRKKTALIPSRVQGVAEVVIGGLHGFMTDLLGDTRKANKYFAFIATILLFILTNNWLALLPGLASIGITEATAHGDIFVPLFRTTNSDLNMTLILAIAAVFMIQVFGVSAIGLFKYGHKFFRNPIKDPIGAFTGILELVSEIARMISFSFRLFGNIFAGEVLLIIVSFLLPYGAPLPFMFLELFVGLVQALVFAILTLVFIKIATVEH